MRKIIAGATLAFASLAGAAAHAGQPVLATSPNAVKLTTVLYEIDYAVSGKAGTDTSVTTYDTLVSLGLPQATTGPRCNVQVAWYDCGGAWRHDIGRRDWPGAGPEVARGFQGAGRPTHWRR